MPPDAPLAYDTGTKISRLPGYRDCSRETNSGVG
jgi:hypothetical protein